MGTFLAIIGILVGLIIVIMMNPTTLTSVNSSINSTANITQYYFLQDTLNSLPLWGFLIVAVMVFALLLRFKKS